jgi:hypothetical protein
VADAGDPHRVVDVADDAAGRIGRCDVDRRGYRRAPFGVQQRRGRSGRELDGDGDVDQPGAVGTGAHPRVPEADVDLAMGLLQGQQPPPAGDVAAAVRVGAG